MHLGRAVVAGVFTAAALASWFVVRQLPLEGRRSPLAAATPEPSPAAPSPPLQPPPGPADGALEVRVTAGGEPVAGAQVVAYRREPRSAGDREHAWRLAGRGPTGGDAIARLFAPPGAYLVAVRSAGFATARARALRTSAERATRVEIALAPPVSLAGRVAGRDGRPVAVRIAAVPEPGEAGDGPTAAPPEERPVAAGDAQGRFEIPGLAPGLYGVTVEAPGFAPVQVRAFVPRADPLAVTLDRLAQIEGEARLPDGRPAAGATVLAAGGQRGTAATSDADGRFAVALPAGTYRLLAASRAGAGAVPGQISVAPGAIARDITLRLGPPAGIDGSVSGDGRPLAGAEVAVLAHETACEVARATAGPDGRFSVDGLAPGPYDLEAKARGRSPARLAGVTLAAGGRFRAAIALAGTGAVEGTVRSPAGQPLAGVRVRVVSRGDGLAGAEPLEVRTDFEGRWRIEGLEAGRAELVAIQEGVATGTSRAVEVRAGGVARADLALAEAGELSGRVTADGHRPPAGTAVIAVPMKAGLGGTPPARAAVDASGNYRLSLPAGEYRVHAAPADAEATDLRVAPGFASVAAGRAARLDLVAARPQAERGTMVAVLEPGGAPSSGAAVTVSRAGDERIAFAARTGEDGRVTLSRDMGLSGPMTVRARNGGRAGAWTGSPAPDSDVTVRLAAGGAIQGTLRSRGGPVREFTVEVATQPSGGWRTLDVHRFSGQRFELGDLPAEPLRLAVRTADGRIGSAEVTVASGEVRPVEVLVAIPAAAGAAR